MITNIYAIDSFVLAFFSFSIITLLIRSTLHAVNEKKKKKRNTSSWRENVSKYSNFIVPEIDV